MEAHPLRRYSKRVNVASGMRLPSRDRGKRDQSDSGVWQSNRRAPGAAAMTAGRSAMRLDRTPRGTWQRRLHGQTARDSRTQAGPSTRSSSERGPWRPPSIIPVTFRIKCVISSNNRSSNNRSSSTRSPWGSTTNLELTRLTQAQLLVVLLMQRSVAACCGCCSSDTYTPD